MNKNQQESRKGKPRSTGKRKAKIAAYFEITYPYRKLLHLYRNGAPIRELRRWADNYKTPTGASGNGALVRLAKVYKLNISQIA